MTSRVVIVGHGHKPTSLLESMSNIINSLPYLGGSEYYLLSLLDSDPPLMKPGKIPGQEKQRGWRTDGKPKRWKYKG